MAKQAVLKWPRGFHLSTGSGAHRKKAKLMGWTHGLVSWTGISMEFRELRTVVCSLYYPSGFAFCPFTHDTIPPYRLTT